MKTMYEYDLVRRLFYRTGIGKSEISRQTGLHRRTINKMLLYAKPPGYRFLKARPKPKLDPFLGIIDQILSDDLKAPRLSSTPCLSRPLLNLGRKRAV